MVLNIFLSVIFTINANNLKLNYAITLVSINIGVVFVRLQFGVWWLGPFLICMCFPDANSTLQAFWVQIRQHKRYPSGAHPTSIRLDTLKNVALMSSCFYNKR